MHCDQYVGTTFKAYVGLTPFVCIHTPEAAEALLSSSTNLRKPFMYGFIEGWLGKRSMVLATGEIWRFKRKLMTPAFHFRALDNYMTIFNQNADLLVRRLGAFINKEPQEPIRLFDNTQKCTLDIIGEVTMGAKLHVQEGQNLNFMSSFNSASFLVGVRGLRPWLWFQSIYDRTYEGKCFKKCMEEIDSFTHTVMQESKAKLENTEISTLSNSNDEEIDKTPVATTLMDILLKAHLQNNRYTVEDVKKDIDTVFGAGNDTTTSAICWTLYLLGHDLRTQAKVHDELDGILGSDVNREITTDDLKQMKYLDCCLKEGLRLYPSFPYIGRVLDHDLEIDGYRIPKDVSCFINIYSLHRNPDHFKDPEEFIPERFMRQEMTSRHPFSYIPFSGGPKNCLGIDRHSSLRQRFATVESKLILAKVLSKFTIQSTRPVIQIKVTFEVIIRARGGHQVWLRRRTPLDSIRQQHD
ncbi:unnamed protein product [Ixodes hexagonus]